LRRLRRLRLLRRLRRRGWLLRQRYGVGKQQNQS
jgi:hypothetical protein